MACESATSSSGQGYLKPPTMAGSSDQQQQQQQQQSRRKSTLSGNGFFIDKSCTRRRSSAARCNQTLRYLSPVHPCTWLTPDPTQTVRRQSHQPPRSQPVSPAKTQQGRSTRACSFAPATSHLSYQNQYQQQQLLSLPVHAPSALAGSRKTSIFDPSGHSIAPHLLGGARRRKSTMITSVAGGCAGASAGGQDEPALQVERTMLSVARSAAQNRSRSCASSKSERTVKHVPVIGCSPTSIKASLAALEETRRYEKLLRQLKRHEVRKEKRRRLADEMRCVEFTGRCSEGCAVEDQPLEDLPADGLRRKSLRAIGNVANSVLSRASGSLKRRRERRHNDKSRMMADGLSVSSMSLESSSSSLSSYDNDSYDDDDDDSSERSYEAAPPLSSPVDRSLQDRCSDNETFFASQQLPSQPDLMGTQKSDHRQQSTNKRSLVKAAMRKLASTISAGSGNSGKRLGPKAKWRSMSAAPVSGGGGGGMNYWYYYYYLRENSMGDSTVGVVEDLPISATNSCGAQAEIENRSRLHINYSLARIEILNSKFQDPSVHLAEKLAEAAAQGNLDAPEGNEMLFDYSNQSTDVSLALSTSTSLDNVSTASSCSDNVVQQQDAENSSIKSSASSASSDILNQQEQQQLQPPQRGSSFSSNCSRDGACVPRCASAEPQRYSPMPATAAVSGRSSMSSGDSVGCAQSAAALSADDECTSTTTCSLVVGGASGASQRRAANHLSLCQQTIRSASCISTVAAVAGACELTTNQEYSNSSTAVPWDSMRQWQHVSGIGNSAVVDRQNHQASNQRQLRRAHRSSHKNLTATVNTSAGTHLGKASSSSSISNRRSASYETNEGQAQGQEEDEEELDDFERLNRCHKNYKPPSSQPTKQQQLQASTPQKGTAIKPRNSSNRLSVRSARVCISNSSTGRADHYHQQGESMVTRAGYNSRISMSWDTLAVACQPEQHLDYSRNGYGYDYAGSDHNKVTSSRRSFKTRTSRFRGKSETNDDSKSMTRMAIDKRNSWQTITGNFDGDLSQRNVNDNGSNLSIVYDKLPAQSDHLARHSRVDYFYSPTVAAAAVATTTTTTSPTSYRSNPEQQRSVSPVPTAGVATWSLPLTGARGVTTTAAGLMDKQQSHHRQTESTAARIGLSAGSLEIPPKLSQQREGPINVAKDNGSFSETTISDLDAQCQQQQQRQQQLAECSICEPSSPIRLQVQHGHGRPFSSSAGNGDSGSYRFRRHHNSVKVMNTTPLQSERYQAATNPMRLIRSNDLTGGEHHPRSAHVELRARAHSTGAGSAMANQRGRDECHLPLASAGDAGGNTGSRLSFDARSNSAGREVNSLTLMRDSVSPTRRLEQDTQLQMEPGGDNDQFVSSAAGFYPEVLAESLAGPLERHSRQINATKLIMNHHESGGHHQQSQLETHPSDRELERKKSVLARSSFTCMLLGARQTGKRTIVKCFVKLLQEFQLAAAEYKREKLLAKLMGCSEHLQEIMNNQLNHGGTDTLDENRNSRKRRESRLNSWFGGSGSAVNRLLSLPTGAAKRRVNSVAITSSLGIGAAATTRKTSCYPDQHHQQRRHTTTVGFQDQQQQHQSLRGSADDKLPATQLSTNTGESAEQGRATRSSAHQDHQFLRVDAPAPGPLLAVNFKLGPHNKSDTNINYHIGNSSLDESIAMDQLQVPTLDYTQNNQQQQQQQSPASESNLTPSSPTRGSPVQHCPTKEHNLSAQMIGSNRQGRNRSAKQSKSKRPALISLKDLNRKRVKIMFRTRRNLSERFLKVFLNCEEESSAGVQGQTQSFVSNLPDCFVVVYSVNDRESFNNARLLVSQLRSIKQDTPLPIVLVANKIDLERAKVVKSEEGRFLARKNSCKFLEISCTIGFNLDNLLVGIRTQLILKHHIALNAILTSSKRDVTRSELVKQTKEKQQQQVDKGGRGGTADNILVRFYRRYVMDNTESVYECDNFSKL